MSNSINLLREACKRYNLDFVKSRNYWRKHPELTIEQLIEYCCRYKTYQKKIIKEVEKNAFEKTCEYYYLDANTVRSYRSRHPELTEQQVIEYYLHRNNRDLKLLNKVLKSIDGNNSISLLSLDTRAYNALRRFGVDTIEQLQYVPLCILKNTRSIGEKSIQNIIYACNNMGIKLREY